MKITTRTRVKRRPMVGALIFLLVGFLAFVERPASWGQGAIYGIAVFSLLTVKLGAAVKHTPSRADPPRRDVAVVIPFFNEDPAILSSCLDSVLHQTYRPAHVVVIDDGSNDVRARVEAEFWQRRFVADGIPFTFIGFDANRGKREALVAGFKTVPTAWAFLCVDSDTQLEPRALYEVMRPFSDPHVTCATGLVIASNWHRNLLTRLIDIRYANAFLFERVAYSTVGSVLCACGSLAVYRADVVRKYADDFLNQRFLGQKAVFGDDRRLTNYSLLEGRAVLQETAIAATAVPERFGHYVRQQVRWNKSFFRESLWVVRHMSMRRPPFWLTLTELTSWLVFTAMLLTAVTVSPVRTGKVLFLTYGTYLVLLGYARSVRYFEIHRKTVSRRQVALTFLLAPLYGLLHIGVLMPLRIYSMATLHRGNWGTRNVVEVGDTQMAPPKFLLQPGPSQRHFPESALVLELASSGRRAPTVLSAAARIRRPSAGQPAHRSRREWNRARARWVSHFTAEPAGVE
jgi:hyaluronan synthase